MAWIDIATGRGRSGASPSFSPLSSWADLDVVDASRLAVATLWRRRVILLVVTAAVCLGAVALALNTPKQYESFAQIAVRQEEPDPLKDEQSFEPRFDDPVTIESEVRLLQTRELFVELVNRLDLANDPAFSPPPSAAVRWMAEAAQSVFGRQAAQSEEAPATRINAALTQLFRSVTVSQVGKSRVIEVAVSTQDPALSARIANTLIDLHIRRQVDRRRDELGLSLVALAQRRDALSRDLQERERALSTFLRGEELVFGEAVSELSPLLQLVEDRVIATEIEARAARAEFEAVTRAMASDGAASAPAFVTSELLLQLETRSAQQRADMADLRVRFGVDHPEFRAAAAVLKELESAIEQAERTIASSEQVELELAEARLRIAKEARESLRARFKDAGRSQVERALLERRRDAALTIFGTVSQRLDKMRERLEVMQPRVEIISRADAPVEAAGPSRKRIVVLGAVLGGVFAAFLALLVDWSDRVLRRREQMTTILGAAPISAPQVDDARPQDLLASQPASVFSKAVRAGAIALFRPGPPPADGLGETVAVTGARSSEQTAALSLALARALGLDGRRVLLVETDRARPTLARLAETPGGPGLSGVLSGQARLAGAIARDAEDLVDVLAAEEADLAPLRGAIPRWRAFLAEAQAAYDVVLVDAPALLDAPETPLALSQCESALLCAWADVTETNDLQRAAMEAAGLVGRRLAGVFVGG